jgi:hypothetical protein
MIIFENEGLIDPMAIATFGVNAKESENPIGFFGTGLKYAIAVIVRTGQGITIWRGLDKYEFGILHHELRGKTFAVVTMNGQPLGFTTELGKQWEVWQAFRELWCNCQDEGGRAYKANSYEPGEGKTGVVVVGQEFANAYDARSRTILDTDPVLSLPGVDVHAGRSQTIFYRGIAVAISERPCLHTYNITSQLDLTEDRTLRYGWKPAEVVAQALQTCDRQTFIEECLRAPEGSFESSIDFIFHGTKPQSAFLEAVKKVSSTDRERINKSAVRQAERHMPLPPIQEMRLNEVQQEQLTRASGFLKRLGYQFDRYNIKFVETLGRGVFGTADNGTITITREAFLGGTKQLAITLIEEFFHLAHDVPDETRAFQERVLHEFISLGERYVGAPL